MKKARRWLIAGAAVGAFALTQWLGWWQWGRAAQKDAVQAELEARVRLPAVDARELLRSPRSDSLLHRAVVLSGEWDASHTIFLDNRQMSGRQGFYVVTPLVLQGASPAAAILVQRGWAPRNFEDRTRLPAVDTPTGPVTVRGILAPPPAKLYELGQAGQGPIRQNLDLAAFRAETHLPLVDVSVRQTGAASEGLARDWPPANGGAATNLGYAFQWWAMSALVAVLYVWFQIIVPLRSRSA